MLSHSWLVNQFGQSFSVPGGVYLVLRNVTARWLRLHPRNVEPYMRFKIPYNDFVAGLHVIM